MVKPLKSDSDAFFQLNHLKGVHSTATSFGLYYEGDLVACMSVRRVGVGLRISRFATKIGYVVRGGFSKLLKYIGNLYQAEFIESYCDLRYATGQSYHSLNFKLEGVTQGWEWTDFKQRFNRRKCRANMDNRKLSQAEHAKELGWSKIYDAGQAKYTLRIKTK